MKYLIQLTVLFILFNANYLNAQVSDSLYNVNKLKLQEQEDILNKQEIRIRDLELEGKIYSDNIQFYTTHYTWIFASIGLIIAVLAWIGLFVQTKYIRNKIVKFKKEYKKDKIYLDDIIKQVFITAHDNELRFARDFEKIKQFGKSINFYLLSLYNLIRYINYLRNDKTNRSTVNIWIIDAQNHFKYVFDLYNKNKININEQIEEEEQSSIVSIINNIINLESDLFHNETIEIMNIMDSINKKSI